MTRDIEFGRLRSITPLAAIASTLMLSACGVGERSASAPVVRDSAGITIVENTAPLWSEAERWQLSAAPEVEIGVLEGEEPYQFNQVRGAFRLSDGRIVAANNGTAELRYYDARGRFLMAAGRRGGGPGEFQYMGVPFRTPGDSILIADGSGTGRISLFDPEGRFVRSYGQPAGRSAGAFMGALTDGTVVRRTGIRFLAIPESGVSRDSLALVRYTAEGELVDTVARLPGSERYRTIQQSGSTMEVMQRPAPFAREQQVAIRGDEIYTGAGDRFEIARYDAERGLVGLIRIERPNRPVTSEIGEQFRRSTLERARDDNARRLAERYLADVTFPATLPAHGALRVDGTGHLWVEEYRAPGEVQPRWSIFDSQGRWLGVLETPPGLEVMDIGSDYLLGLWKDELDVEHLRLYRVDKPLPNM
jgi:hypothetical protein